MTKIYFSPTVPEMLQSHKGEKGVTLLPKVTSGPHPGQGWLPGGQPHD